MPSLRHRASPWPPSCPRRGWLFTLLATLVLSVAAFAGNFHLNDQTRQQIIREFLAETPFLHCELLRGKAGVRIAGGKVSPQESELKQQSLVPGSVARTGERVRITAVKFERRGLLFEINGGPKGHTSWRDHVQIGVGGSVATPSTQVIRDEDEYGSQRGASILLELADEKQQLTTARIREMLAPLLDFHSQSAAEAYQQSLPPKLAAAIQQHRALVGMDRTMVLCAMGRPPKRIRESEDGKDFEEWIYGEPPRNVQFIRFLDERVVRIEEMQVGGEKKIRTEDEVGELPQRRSAPGESEDASREEPRSAPSLLRPGEQDMHGNPVPAGPRKLPPDGAPTGNGDPTTNGPRTPGN